MNQLLSLPRKFIVWTLLFLCFDSVFWALLFVGKMMHIVPIAADNLLQCLSLFLTALLCFSSIRRPNKAALFFGLGLLTEMIGQGIWGYYELIVTYPPFPSFADLFFLATYPLFFLAILLLPSHRFPTISLTRVALDGMMIMTGILTFGWYFVLSPNLMYRSDTLLTRVLAAIYPCCDMILLLCLVLLWIRQENLRMRSVLVFLTLGLLIIIITDSVFDYLSLQNSYTIGNFIDPLWSLGYQCIGLATLVLQQKPKEAVMPAIMRSQPLWRLLLPYALIPPLILLILYTWHTTGDEKFQAGVYIGAGVLVALILLRQLVAMRELHLLYVSNDALTSANKQLEVQATHDALTGLPNRKLLHSQLETLSGATNTGGLPTTLMLLDLDRFKEVNDTLGHDVGDLLLQEIGPRLQGYLRPIDLLARLGGDEFAIVLPATDAARAIEVTLSLLSALEAPFLIKNQTFYIRASIGIALTPEHGLDVSTLLRCADVAMYVAKRDHSGYTVYTSEIDQNSPRKLNMMSELRHTIANDGLLLHYQPKVSLAQDQIVGVEALVRWPHPVHGLIPPDEFIPMAEQSGLIAPLTWWVLQQAIRQCHDWEQDGLYLNIAVNLSTHTLYDQELLPTVMKLLQTYEIPPNRLTLEITESTLMDNPERAQIALTRLREFGVLIALDDFGTGYSSLAYLKRLSLDEIKIDKAFVLGLGTNADPTDEAIVRAVTAMAHPLHCEVVAEGVENRETWTFLQEIGCNMAQGYYLSRPLSATDLTKWAQTTPWRAMKWDGLLVRH